jgi:diaminopimelate decarboxylase
VTIKFEGFKYKNHSLELDGVSLASIADKVGTPFYVYSAEQILKNFQELTAAFKGRSHLICYAVKANSNLAILKLLAQAGSGAEVVSGGELFRALEAGFAPDKIIFDGVGKTREEIDYALKKKILFFNVESEQELIMIDCVAKAQKKMAFVSFRVNPDVNPKTHPYIATGLRKSKFGIPFKKAPELIRSALSLKNVYLMGLGCHIGSQITSLSPYAESVKKLMKLYQKTKEQTSHIAYMNLGGGLGITYKNERVPALSSWVQTLCKEVKDPELTLVIEPGRVIVGNAGALVTAVNYVKRGEADNFIITDAGMNDLMRPSLYEAYHSILPVKYKRYKKIKASVVGPVCETADTLARARRIQNFQQGDLMAIMSCGAYAATMGSQYNSRPRPPEVLVQNGRFHIIRERETYEDLISREKIPSGLKKISSANLAVMNS